MDLTNYNQFIQGFISVFILNLILQFKQIMYQIDMAVYEQMGFARELVKKACQYSKANKVDVFDALQYLQKTQNKNQSLTPENNPDDPQKSMLYPFKNVNLNNFEVVFSKKQSRMNLLNKKMDVRQQFTPVGLLNVYNCCYLNSLLQCYFLSSDLIKYIFEAEPLSCLQSLQSKTNKVKIKRIQNQYNLLYTLKDIFSRMCLTSKKYINPTEVLRNLVDSLGQKIQFGEEKDLFQTNILIIERLNQCLLYTKKYFREQTQSTENKEKCQTSDLNSPGKSVNSTGNFVNSTGNSVNSTGNSVNSPGKSVINNSKIRQRDNIKRLFYGKKVEYTDPIKENQNLGQVLSDFLGIIINPVHENLYRALEQEFHYEVQIQIPEEKRKVKTRKHTYIREVPEYLYFYINRMGYNAQQKQALKNQQKLSFDFVIYLDRFLERYKQQASKNTPLIIQLWKKKNSLRKKMHKFQIFAKKLQECRHYAQQIDGWEQKLPLQEDVDSEKQRIQSQLHDVERQLQKIESRNQKYELMYIFSHRGDAVSGHYWGYGRNAEAWYKFDINTKKMKEQQILLDLYKCGGTPYALVYVKQKHLPKMTYKYYKDFSLAAEQNLISTDYSKQTQGQDSYVGLIPQGMKKVIVSENIQIHQQMTKRRNLQISMKTVKQYLTRFNWLESQVQQILKKQNTSNTLPSYDNFALYLWTKKQVDLAKYNIFAVSLKQASDMSTTQLIQKETLLNLIQKQFRKKVKSNKILKHFCITYEPREGEKYSELLKSYFMQKQTLQMVLNLFACVDEVQKQYNENKSSSQKIESKINKLLKRVAILIRVGQKNNSYIKFILIELTSVFLLKFILTGCTITINQQELATVCSDNLKQQIYILGKKQNLKTQKGDFNLEYYHECNLNDNDLWNVEDVGKGPNQQTFQKKMNSVLSNLKRQISIFKKLQKQHKFSQINQETGQVQGYSGPKASSQQESLI